MTGRFFSPIFVSQPRSCNLVASTTLCSTCSRDKGERAKETQRTFGSVMFISHSAMNINEGRITGCHRELERASGFKREKGNKNLMTDFDSTIMTVSQYQLSAKTILLRALHQQRKRKQGRKNYSHWT